MFAKPAGKKLAQARACRRVIGATISILALLSGCANHRKLDGNPIRTESSDGPQAVPEFRSLVGLDPCRFLDQEKLRFDWPDLGSLSGGADNDGRGALCSDSASPLGLRINFYGGKFTTEALLALKNPEKREGVPLSASGASGAMVRYNVIEIGPGKFLNVWSYGFRGYLAELTYPASVPQQNIDAIMKEVGSSLN
jgi:hypothetical protein